MRHLVETLLGRATAGAPELLELAGASAIAAGLWLLFGLGAALLWVGIACLVGSYMIEARRRPVLEHTEDRDAAAAAARARMEQIR